VESDHDSRRHRPPADINIFVADAQGAPSDWMRRWLLDSGARCVIAGTHLESLPQLLRQHLDAPQSALAVITTDQLDGAFLEQCQRFQRLAEEGSLGIVAAVHGTAPDSSALRQAHAAGCLDVIHTPAQQPPTDAFSRLHLAQRLLEERHLRLHQAQQFRTQLAERRVMEARLNYIAAHDELTDLTNRSTFEKALDRAILVGARQQIPHALLYIDLDRFKLHNDAAGHAYGNRLLQTIANRLRSALPREYPLARLGSDEFAVLLQGTDDREALRIAEQLRSLIADIEPDGEQIVYHVGISVGLAMLPPGSVTDASQALAHAEQACYVAKTRGGNAVHLFSQGDDILQHLRDDMHWSQPIRLALSSNQLFLSFQPILDIKKQNISHYEALVRIPQQLGGDDQSARFMLAAERLGLAQQIDLWVVNNAIDYLAGNGDISLGINLSSHAFQENALLPLLHEKLQSSRIAPQRITFEITETAAIMNFADTRRMVSELRELGCRFALDDFGSGFSTYHYIKQFPIDILKIDGSFIVNVTQDPQDKAIVQSMINIAHSLGKEVVAEFIEDAETLELLTRMGIDHAQGYYIGRPTVDPTARSLPNDRETLQ